MTVSNKKILIVHEDLDVGLLLSSVLKGKYEKIELANTFSNVEEKVQSQPFDLVLTDVNIQGISRNQYITFLNDKLPHAKIVVMTDMDQQIIEKELFELGIEGFLDFPLTLGELNKALID